MKFNPLVKASKLSKKKDAPDGAPLYELKM